MEPGTLKWWFRMFAYLTAGTIFCAYLLGRSMAEAQTSSGELPAWASPTHVAIKRVSTLGSAQSEPNFLNNLDCTLVTYHLVASNTMQTGCFTETAFGLIDSDSETVIFNGTDEGLPLLGYTPHQVLAPWPRTLDLVSLDAVNTGGSYISLYRNPLGVIQDQRNILFQLTAKKLTMPPDLPLVDKFGQKLVINAQTLAFSDGGSWLVAENLNGSFVRINLATLDMKAFAPAYGSQGSPALLKSRVAITGNGHYAVIANDVASSFKVYDLTGCSGTPVNLQPESCPTHDYWPYAKSQIPGLLAIRHVRFVNDGLVSFEAVTSSGAGDGIYELAPRESIDSLIDYLGIGDSYTSGEGAFDYLDGTDLSNNKCHLSARSYPLLLTHDLFTARGGHSVACSGAVINDVGSLSENYRGQVREGPSYKELAESHSELLASIMTNFVPGYVAQQRFVGQYQPSVTTVSIGGNDVGFGDILATCLLPHISRHLSDSVCFNTYEDRLEVLNLIDRTVPRWVGLFKQLRASAPATRLYVIGYPSVVYDKGSCGLNVQLSKSELEFSEELVRYLNAAIKQAAARSGVVYIDITDALVGHRLCEANSANIAVNGLTAGDDTGPFGHESYHPNALGQQLIEQAILQKTGNLTLALPGIEEKSDSQKLLDAPRSGRKVQVRSPVKMTASIVKRGQAVSVKIKGSGAGLKPGSGYTVGLDGPGGTVIGPVTSDNYGDVDTVITIPPSITPGYHTIDVTGENQSGGTTDVTQPIYVPVSDTDADGDGVPNTSDSCVYAVNSGADADQDGIDDVCDGFIGPPPAPSAGNTGGNSSSSSGNPPPIVLPPQGYGDNTGISVSTGRVTIVAKVPVNSSGPFSVARVLGSATVNPTALAHNSFEPISKRALASTTPHPALNAINILPWAGLAVIAWLLLILVGYLGGRIQNEYQNTSVSATMNT